MIKKYTKVNCDNCKKDFKLKPKNFKKKIIDGVKVEYFTCKHCKKVYIYLCKDDYIEAKQKEYAKFAADIKALNAKLDNDNFQDIVVKITELRNKKLDCLKDMKKHSDELEIKIKDKL